MTTNTTNTTSGAAIQRYKIGYHEDEWGQRSSTPGGIPDASGPWVRYEDHIAALAAGQAKAAQSGLTDAYVGAREDLSIWKRRALEAEATVRNFVREANSPTFMGDPASDECHHGDAYIVNDCLRCGAPVCCGKCCAAEATPHGQVPVVQGDALSDAVRVPLDSLHADAAYLIGRLREGSMPYARVIEIIRERIDAAKAAIRARAAHGQAPAGATKPTEQQILEAAEKAGLWPNTVHSWIPAFHRYHKELAKAQPAQARADRVQEDAARYRLLRRGRHWSVIDVIGNDLLRAEALDAAVDAARKQGASQ